MTGAAVQPLPPVEANPYLTLAQASRIMPGVPSPTTAWRWCRKGLRDRDGVRHCLRHLRVGQKIYTTREWADEFLAALAGGPA